MLIAIMQSERKTENIILFAIQKLQTFDLICDIVLSNEIIAYPFVVSNYCDNYVIM